MGVVTVSLGARSYPIHIGSGLVADGALLASFVRGSQIAIVTNDVVAPLALEPLLAALESSNATIDVFTLPDGVLSHGAVNHEDCLVRRLVGALSHHTGDL